MEPATVIEEGSLGQRKIRGIPGDEDVTENKARKHCKMEGVGSWASAGVKFGGKDGEVATRWRSWWSWHKSLRGMGLLDPLEQREGRIWVMQMWRRQIEEQLSGKEHKEVGSKHKGTWGQGRSSSQVQPQACSQSMTAGEGVVRDVGERRVLNRQWDKGQSPRQGGGSSSGTAPPPPWKTRTGEDS